MDKLKFKESLDNIKRDSKAKAIEMVSQNPSLNKFEKETIYREVGQFDESQIAFLVDDLCAFIPLAVRAS